VPKDSFGLYVDGIDLLCGATDESLAVVVPDLIEAAAAMFLEGECLAQVSLTEAHAELMFHRRDPDVEVTVVSLARPAKLMRPPVQIELVGLKKAAASCAHTLMQDLTEASPAMLKGPKVNRMTRKLLALEHSSVAAQRREWKQTGYSYRTGQGTGCSLGFELWDPEDLLLYRGAFAALPSLLFPGSVRLWPSRGHEPVWEGKDSLFLMVLELSRQGSDLCQAIELGEARFSFAPAGHLPKLELDLEHEQLETRDGPLSLPPADLAKAIFDLGLAVTFAITARSKRQAKNPYLAEIADRCHEGLALLRTASHPPASETPARGERRGISAGATRPLQSFGRLRRLRYLKRWEKQKLGGKEQTRLLLGSQGPLVSSSEMACAFDPEGRLRYRRLGIHGVAASADGYTVTASADHLAGFRGVSKSAEWVRDHDGSVIGPEMERRGGLLICLSESRSVLALSEVTGRVIWRIIPPRARRSFFTLHGHRVLVATEPGVIYGLELADGQIRYRVRGSPPLVGAAVHWGRKFLAISGRGDRHTLLAADAHGGSIQWTYALSLSLPSVPLAQRHGVLIAGEGSAGDGVVLRLGTNGRPAWEQKLSLGRGPFALTSVGQSVVVAARSGAAALLSQDGQVRWQVGPSGAELPTTLSPYFARGVLILPGEIVRAIDPADGEILAELRAGVGLCDLRVDPKLNLYLLDEEGSLKSYRLASHFAVIRGQSS
jgi:hypothetical protein